MTIVGFIVCGVITDRNLPSGDPLKLSSPVDYLGRTCGHDPRVSDKPYAYYLADSEGIIDLLKFRNLLKAFFFVFQIIYSCVR